MPLHCRPLLGLKRHDAYILRSLHTRGSRCFVRLIVATRRYFRIDATGWRTFRENSDPETRGIKRLDFTLSKHVFDSSDPISVLTFLTRFVRDANILEISKAQAYLALPYFLRGFSLKGSSPCGTRLHPQTEVPLAGWSQNNIYTGRTPRQLRPKRRYMISAGSRNWKAKTSVTIATDWMTRAVVPVMFSLSMRNALCSKPG